MVLREGILYKEVLARSPLWSRNQQIYEADSDIVRLLQLTNMLPTV